MVIVNDKSFLLGEHTGSTKVQENPHYQEQPQDSDLSVLKS